jgi:hypothetical protein
MCFVQQRRARSRSRGSPKADRRSPSREGEETMNHLDEELRLIIQDAEEALSEADKTLRDVETDKGSSFRRSRTRSSASPGQKRREVSHGATGSPGRKRVSSDDDRGSPRSPHQTRENSMGGEISPQTLPVSPEHQAAVKLSSSAEVKLAKHEMRARIESEAEHELRHERSPSPRRYDENYEDQCTFCPTALLSLPCAQLCLTMLCSATDRQDCTIYRREGNGAPSGGAIAGRRRTTGAIRAGRRQGPACRRWRGPSWPVRGSRTRPSALLVQGLRLDRNIAHCAPSCQQEVWRGARVDHVCWQGVTRLRHGK